MGRGIIQLGALLIVVGTIVWLVERAGVPRLPGDIVLKRKGWSFYAPLGTSLLISVVLTVLANVFFRRR